MRVGTTDIAARAQVSEATVSRIINRRQGMARTSRDTVEIRGIRRLGRSVPQDVSVVGYDGTGVTEFTDPPLTTVRQPADRLALEVGRSILTLVGGRDVPTGELLFDPELVVRASTGAAPAGA
ncbi:substrate-binding domain-containing protein [Streptomyces sp. NPDC004244]